MNFDNYGKYNGEFNFGWDIDHIIPTSSAKTEEEIIKLNHYTNLKPFFLLKLFYIFVYAKIKIRNRNQRDTNERYNQRYH